MEDMEPEPCKDSLISEAGDAFSEALSYMACGGGTSLVEVGQRAVCMTSYCIPELREAIKNQPWAAFPLDDNGKGKLLWHYRKLFGWLNDAMPKCSAVGTRALVIIAEVRPELMGGQTLQQIAQMRGYLVKGSSRQLIHNLTNSFREITNTCKRAN
jgi:hypothetical protein